MQALSNYFSTIVVKPPIPPVTQFQLPSELPCKRLSKSSKKHIKQVLTIYGGQNNQTTIELRSRELQKERELKQIVESLRLTNQSKRTQSTF